MATPADDERGRIFPLRSVIILAMVLTTQGYTLTNLFPYVGMMAKLLLGLPTTNESGMLKRGGGLACCLPQCPVTL